MTVEVTTNKVQLPGDGSVFTFSSGTMEAFVAPDPTEIEVYVDDGSGNVTTYTEGTGSTNYSVTFTDPTARKSTFTITLPADSGTALLATDTVTIKNTPPKTQATDLSNQGAYLAEAQEETFDRLVLTVQDIGENVDRSIRTNVTEQTFVDLELPNVDSVSAGSTLLLKSDKTGIEWGALAGTLPDPVTVARGGTGATTAAAARTALGVDIGTDVQAWDTQLDDIAALAVTDGNIIVGDGTNWVAETGATARTSLGLAIGTDVQAWDAQLDDIAALAVTDGNIIVGDGTNWVAETGATARTSLGVAIGTNVQAWDAGLDDIAGISPASGETIIGDGANWVTHTLYARTGQQRIINSHAKVGATAGWVVDAADDLGLLATCPASQTASTLVVPISGLKVGDTITAFSVVGQIESAGNTVTLDANLRKLTAAAADVTDASIDSITQISVTADTAVATSKTLGASEDVAADETFYVLLTATTGALTDIALQGLTVTVTEA